MSCSPVRMEVTGAGKLKTLSKTVVLPGEDHQAYDRLLDAIKQLYKPANPIEEAHVLQIAVNTWRLNRLALIETDLFAAAGSPAEAITNNWKAFETLMRYENTLLRGRAKAEKELLILKQSGFVCAKPTKPAKAPEPPPNPVPKPEPKHLFVDCRTGKVTQVQPGGAPKQA